MTETKVFSQEPRSVCPPEPRETESSSDALDDGRCASVGRPCPEAHALLFWIYARVFRFTRCPSSPSRDGDGDDVVVVVVSVRFSRWLPSPSPADVLLKSIVNYGKPSSIESVTVLSSFDLHRSVSFHVQSDSILIAVLIRYNAVSFISMIGILRSVLVICSVVSVRQVSCHLPRSYRGNRVRPSPTSVFTLISEFPRMTMSGFVLTLWV